MYLRRATPRPRVARRTSPWTLALSAKLLREVLRRYLLKQIRLITCAKNTDFRNSYFIKPAFNDRPDGGEGPGRVDDIELAHRFGVSVLSYRRRLHHVVLDAVEVAEADVLEIEDCAGGFDRMSSLLGARRKTLMVVLLVFVD